MVLQVMFYLSHGISYIHLLVATYKPKLITTLLLSGAWYACKYECAL